MNVTGKILVILNLIFAVVVGGFLVVDFATRSNWRNEYFRLRDEMQVAKSNWETVPGSLSSLQEANKRLVQERDAAREELVVAQAKLVTNDNDHKVALDAADKRATDADLTAQIALAEKERLNKEHQALLIIIAQRDNRIVGQQADIVKFRNAAVSEESARKATQDRLDQSLTRNAELEKTIVKMTTGGTGGDAIVEHGKPNPPAVYVEGKIDAIHKQDAGLVQLTVGSDKGLKQNQTLEVYRTEPQALYLGMIRIVDVQPHTAVGRLERVGTANRAPLRIGDIVASTLSRN